MAEDAPPRGSCGFETVQFGSSGARGPQRWALAVGVVLAVAVSGLVIRQVVAPDASSPPGRVGSSASTERTGTAGGGGAVQTTPVPPPADQPKVSRIDVSWLHAKSDWMLFVRTDESVVGVQPRSGRVRTTAVPALQSDGPVSFVVRRGEVLIRPLDVVPGYVIGDGQAAHRSGLPPGGLIYPGPAPDQLWIPDGDRRVDLVRLDGSRIGPTIRMPAGSDPFPRADGSGHLLLTGVGGTYLARADGLHRVTTGAVVATGPRSLVMIECNSRARCQPSVYDQRTGTKHSVPTQLPPAQAITDGVTSPDGNRMAFASGTDQTPIVTLVDLRTGHQQVVAARINRGAPDGQAIAWSPDNRWVFIASLNASLDGMIQVANGSTGAVRTLDLGLHDVQQVAIRP